MTEEANTYAENIKPTANNSSILTPCSTEALAESIENPETDKAQLNKREKKASEKINS
tara:strand:- start:3086 stop:3259 length:174 start_codon:yes stop_codon:yes gene_type:complete